MQLAQAGAPEEAFHEDAEFLVFALRIQRGHFIRLEEVEHIFGREFLDDLIEYRFAVRQLAVFEILLGELHGKHIVEFFWQGRLHFARVGDAAELDYELPEEVPGFEPLDQTFSRLTPIPLQIRIVQVHCPQVENSVAHVQVKLLDVLQQNVQVELDARGDGHIFLAPLCDHRREKYVVDVAGVVRVDQEDEQRLNDLLLEELRVFGVELRVLIELLNQVAPAGLELDDQVPDIQEVQDSLPALLELAADLVVLQKHFIKQAEGADARAPQVRDSQRMRLVLQNIRDRVLALPVLQNLLRLIHNWNQLDGVIETVQQRVLLQLAALLLDGRENGPELGAQAVRNLCRLFVRGLARRIHQDRIDQCGRLLRVKVGDQRCQKLMQFIDFGWGDVSCDIHHDKEDRFDKAAC